jgi:uncharacterized protein
LAAPPADFDASAVAAIRERLDAVRAQGARVLFAIESGSRAWGFPSPDSDYDCRFVFHRSAADHLVLEPQRDVVEFPLEGLIDTGGWDLRKALLLALKGNAVVVEWAKAPIAYEEEPGFRTSFVALLDRIVDPVKISRHYLGLARAQLSRVGSVGGEVRLKKLFYLVRPIVALDWMAEKAFSRLPPMNMVECLDGARIPQAADASIRELIEAKRLTRELGSGPVPPPTACYLEARYGFHEMNLPPVDANETVQTTRRRDAEAFYRTVVEAGSGS